MKLLAVVTPPYIYHFSSMETFPPRQSLILLVIGKYLRWSISSIISSGISIYITTTLHTLKYVSSHCGSCTENIFVRTFHSWNGLHNWSNYLKTRKGVLLRLQYYNNLTQASQYYLRPTEVQKVCHGYPCSLLKTKSPLDRERRMATQIGK